MKISPFKVLIIGFGSIGKKHSQILRKFNCKVVVYTKQKNISYKTIHKKETPIARGLFLFSQ